MSVSSLPKVNCQFLPILLKGHERSITTVKYNADGDLLFTAAKDSSPTCWYADTGVRVGTYGHHKGAVWDLDPNWDSKYIVTACADGSARLFDLPTGNYIARMPHRGAVRAVTWAEGTHFFATAADPFTSREHGAISIFSFPSEEDLSEAPIIEGSQNDNSPIHTACMEIKVDPLNKSTCLGWSIANEHVIAGFDSGLIVKYDVETGKEVTSVKVHQDRVNRFNFNKDKTLMLTASKDRTAKLLDPVNLEVVKSYTTPAPVNGAVMSPTHPHVLLGGGQEAMHVTVTGHQSGKFETRFFHQVYEEEFGRVKGHFGPINALAIHPYGKSYASGSEDGFIRLHHFDQAYMKTNDMIADSLKQLYPNVL